MLAVAQGELGYTESSNGYSKYGAWFGTPYCQWCAEFITWCVWQADERNGTSLLRNLYPYYGNPKDGAPWFIRQSRFVGSDGKILSLNARQWDTGTKKYLGKNEYIPYPGDYMWLYIPSWGYTTYHVAIVEGVSKASDGSITVHVIEGNMPSKVQHATYKLTDPHIYGFGTPVKRVQTDLRLYNKSKDVITVKKWLKQLGIYKNSDMTNSFTTQLRDAVKTYQKKNKLKTTGIVDKTTWLSIKSAAAKASKNKK